MASKHEITAVSISGDNVTFTVRIRGAVKDQAARPNWVVSDMNLMLSGNAVSLKELLGGYVASSHFWVKIQGWLRRCPQQIVESFVGESMSWMAFKAAIAAALPEGGEKAELRSELKARNEYIEKLRRQLKNLGMSDEQIEAALKE